MDLETAIRERRTHKVYAAQPVARETLDALFDLARWAPNHHITSPWRFRVLGPEALARLKDAAGTEDAAKLDRAPTLVAVTQVIHHDDEIQDAEDRDATAVASYIVLLAAHGRGLAGYWRTPGVLRTDAGRAALGVPAGERVIGLLHLGHARQEQRPPERAPVSAVVQYLD